MMKRKEHKKVKSNFDRLETGNSLSLTFKRLLSLPEVALE